MEARPAEIALEFLRRFCAGDIEGLGRLLSPRLRFRGPLVEADSAKAYLDALRADPPGTADFRLLHVSDDGPSVALFYDYVKPEGTVTVAQTMRVEAGVVTEIRVVFDTAPLA